MGLLILAGRRDVVEPSYDVPVAAGLIRVSVVSAMERTPHACQMNVQLQRDNGYRWIASLNRNTRSTTTT